MMAERAVEGTGFGRGDHGSSRKADGGAYPSGHDEGLSIAI